MLIGLYGLSEFPSQDWLSKVEALAAEAGRQGAVLCYFDDSGVDVDKECVHALFWENGSPQRRMGPYPDVIISAPWAEAGAEPTKVERKLRARVPFTSRPRDDLPPSAEWLLAAEGSGEAPSSGKLPLTRVILQRGAESRWHVVQPACCPSCAERAMRSAEAINERYPFLIEQMSVELRHEAEAADVVRACYPSGSFAEGELSVRQAIAYALYLAELCKGARKGPPLVVGLLAADNGKETLVHEACAAVAALYGAALYRFRSADVNDRWPIVKGCELRRGRWESRYWRYPDALIDRLKERGSRSRRDVYQKLAAVPCVDERTSGSFDKARLYRILEQDPALSRVVIPFEPLVEAAAGGRFLERHGASVIKPVNGSYGERMVIVEPSQDGFLVRDYQHYHKLTGGELTQLLSALAHQRVYLIQKFIDSRTREGFPFHLRVHLVRNAAGGWSELSCTPYIALQADSKIVNHASVFRAQSRWGWFLEHQFPGREDEMKQRVWRLSADLAACVEADVSERMSELGIDFGIDSQGRMWLFEMNMNKVGAVYHEFELAQIMIPAAIRLAEAGREPAAPTNGTSGRNESC